MDKRSSASSSSSGSGASQTRSPITSMDARRHLPSGNLSDSSQAGDQGDDAASYHSRASSYQSRISHQYSSSRSSSSKSRSSDAGEESESYAAAQHDVPRLKFQQVIKEVGLLSEEQLKIYFDKIIKDLAISAEQIDDMQQYKDALRVLLKKYYDSKAAGNKDLEATFFYALQDTTTNLLRRGDNDSFYILFSEKPELIRFIDDQKVNALENKILEWVEYYVNAFSGVDDGGIQIIENCIKYNADFTIFNDYNLEGLLEKWGVHRDDIEGKIDNLNEIHPLAKLKAPHIERFEVESFGEEVAAGEEEPTEDLDTSRVSQDSQVSHVSSLSNDSIWREINEIINDRKNPDGLMTAEVDEIEEEFRELSAQGSSGHDQEDRPRVSTPIPPRVSTPILQQGQLQEPTNAVRPSANAAFSAFNKALPESRHK